MNWDAVVKRLLQSSETLREDIPKSHAAGNLIVNAAQLAAQAVLQTLAYALEEGLKEVSVKETR